MVLTALPLAVSCVFAIWQFQASAPKEQPKERKHIKGCNSGAGCSAYPRNKFSEYFFSLNETDVPILAAFEKAEVTAGRPPPMLVHKWHHYFDVYERHFRRFRGMHPVIFEIGVFGGGSMDMWNHYFDGDCTIYGMDVNGGVKRFEQNFKNVKTIIGDQGNVEFWRETKKWLPKVDIFIDDGGHTMPQQINTFNEMYEHIKADGVYLVEDVHTSYSSDPYFMGGPPGSPQTFQQFAKNMTDKLNAHYWSWSGYGKGKPTIATKEDIEFRSQTLGISFYDSIVVFEKGKNHPPTNSMRAIGWKGGLSTPQG